MADKPVEPPSIGKGFVDKLEAKEIGIGPAFVEKLEANDESVVASLRKRAGCGAGEGARARWLLFLGGFRSLLCARPRTATEGLKAASTATLSRLSSAASEVVPAVEGTFAAAASWVMGDGGHDGSLHNAVARLRVKDLLVPGQEVVFVETHDSVAKLEARTRGPRRCVCSHAVQVLLREQHIHSVPVWNPPAKRWEGVVDTGDLVVWASVKFPKSQLDAWTTFRQEAEFGAQHVADIVNVSQRNRFCATTPETEALTVLEAFRDLDIHRVFVRRGEHELLGVLTHTDILRFLNQGAMGGAGAGGAEWHRSRAVGNVSSVVRPQGVARG